ncbi:MAG: hypothetical protein A3D92_21270 [Bacteroidetes bacterium RIFCSPHIGHO2_02_FULL_44_7]|nr:MAG: hypothetical protein A3D92_21270 [Bacteroidetes bacterium RIFCSPHIGHO2_02_FULL_44_7]
MFQRFVSAGMIGLILLYSVGYFPIYKLEQNRITSEIKKRIKQSVPEAELHLISFRSLQDIVWTKPGKEFILGEHMYDVVHNVSKEGRVQFLCINDVEESILFARLDDLVNRLLGSDGNPVHKSGKQIIKLVSLIEDLIQIDVDVQPYVVQQVNFPETFSFYETECMKVPLPPPELAA